MKEEAAPAPHPGRCIYGYALFIICSIGAMLYIAWAFTPSSWLRAIGLSYFSSKYYPLALPVFFCTGIFLFASIIYPAINFCLCVPITSPNLLIDSHTRNESSGGGIPPISDIPIVEVNEMLYRVPDI
jgi:phosphatidylinositol glycan class P protein